MIQQKVVVNNGGPVEAIFEDVAVGSSLQFSFLFEEETTPGSGIFTPMDLAGFTFVSEARRSPYDADPAATLAAVARGPQEQGWVDFTLGATATTELGETDLHWSFKVVPVADAEGARSVLFGIIPIRYRGTR